MTKRPGERGLDFLARVGCARPDIIDEVPGDRPRFVAMALVLFSTAAMSALSATFAFVAGVHFSPVLAVPLGLLWGLMIFNLDRLLVLGMPYEIDRPARRTWLLALPRVLLAIVIGTIIATPLTLQVFRPEINAEITKMRDEADSDFQAALLADPYYSTRPELLARVAADQTAIANKGTIDLSVDPVYVSALAEVTRAQSTYESAEKVLQAELDGSGGTQKRGSGPIAAEKRSARDRALADLQAAKSKLATAEASAQTRLSDASTQAADIATAALATDQRALDALDAKLAAANVEHDAAIAVDNGILNQIRALDRLSREDWMLFLAQLMLALMLIAFELLPVLTKTLANLGRPTAYDRLVATKDNSIASAGKVWATGREKAIEAEVAREIKVAEHRAGLQAKFGLEVNKIVVAKQEQAVRRALVVWGRYATKRAATRIHRWERELRAEEAAGMFHEPFAPRSSGAFAARAGLSDPGEI